MPTRKKLIDTDTLLTAPAAKNKLVTVDKPDTSERAKARRTPSKANAAYTEQQVKALTDMRHFADLISFHGGWDKFGECHGELVDFLVFPQTDDTAQQKLAYLGDEEGAGLRRMVLMPRGHLKSSLGTVLYTLWRIYRNPNIRILVACNLQTLAFSFIREVRSYFESQDLDKVWNNRPHIEGSLLPALDKRSRTRNFSLDTEAEDRKVIWNNTALQVLRPESYKEPTLFATSVGTTVTGMHYDLVILDDLVDFKNVESEVKKRQVEEWIADIESVLNPPAVVTVGNESIQIKDTLGGEIVVNGTRYALDDYYGQVLEKADELGYKTHIRNIYKNGVDASQGYLWHEKYTHNIVKSLQARLSPRRFSSQYLNRVYEKDAALFAVDCIRIIDSDSFFVNGGSTFFKVPGTQRIEKVNPIIAIDPAFSTSKSGDDCAIVSGFKLHDGTLVVYDVELDRMTAAEVVANTLKHCRRLSTLRVFYEQNGVGMLVGELFKHPDSYLDGKPVIAFGHYEQRVKESKIQGILELPIASGKLWFTEKVAQQEPIMKQLKNYPAVSHDDFLDGLVTLFEKTTPARESFDPTIQNISIDGIRLGIDKTLDDRSIVGKLKESFLATFNQFFS
jgi:hypothetical protein